MAAMRAMLPLMTVVIAKAKARAMVAAMVVVRAAALVTMELRQW